MKSKYVGLLLLIFINSISCKKSFLDVPDKSVLIRQAYVTDLTTTEHFLNGIYVELASVIYQGYNLIYPDLVADNIKPVAGNAILNPHYTWVQQADDRTSATISKSDVNMNQIWFNGYRVIRGCSFVLENVDKYRNEDVAKADIIKGQAYALRAFIHSLLVNIFSQPYSFSPDASHPGIPYVLSSDVTNANKRITVSEVYKNMISDLTNATSLLPESFSDKLRFNHYASKAMLARIYLAKGDFVAAKTFAIEVGAKVPLMKIPDYPKKLFTDQEAEALFQLPPSWATASNAAGSYSNYFAGLYFESPAFQYTATNDIASILKENLQDVRNVWVKDTSGSWRIRKYPTKTVTGYPAPTVTYYQTLIRSSEMSLIAAEAYNQIGGNSEDSAVYYLDQIRQRADPSVSPTTSRGVMLQDSIYKEKRKEFAFEGHRIFDLLRWKKPVNRLDATNSTATNLPFPSNKAIAPLPIPDVSIAGMGQNPGY